MSKFKIYFKDLNVQTVYGVDLLDAVVDPTHDRVSYFFRKGTGLVEAERAVGGEVESVSMVAGAPVLRGKASLMAQKINRSKVETAFFGDRNVIIAVHNGEGAYVLVDWLAYHQSKFRLGGAVIVERSADARREWNDVATDPRIASMDMRLLVLTTDVPLGNPDLPAEAHPYCVDGAPGRDRMNRPAPDPWRSPIQEFGIYGLVYERYLKAARAVANIDPCDLLIVTDEGVSPFDLAVANPGGVVQLAGRHCYPWRVRKNKKPMFSDHSCVQFDTKSIRQRCCVAPDGLPNTALFRIKRVTGGSIVASAPFWRCMAIRHPPKWQYPIVPKTSLVEYAPLLDLMESTFNTTPVRAPSVQLKESDSGAGSTD